ncbi:MAG: hypothetical protein LBR20_00910 [Propionibacteriaceae bacterium]|nr:hypothetical protein [Propionibacteriaceae bacterium]
MGGKGAFALVTTVLAGLLLTASASISDSAPIGGEAAPVKKFTKTAIPKIKGTLTPGSKLTAQVSGWWPKPTRYAYQWVRNGHLIAKATSASYTVTANDVGAKIVVRVRGYRNGFTSVRRSSKAVTIKAAPATKTPVQPQPTVPAETLHLPFNAPWRITQTLHATNAYDFTSDTDQWEVLAVGSGTAVITCIDTHQAFLSLTTSQGVFRYFHLDKASLTEAGFEVKLNSTHYVHQGQYLGVPADFILHKVDLVPADCGYSSGRHLHLEMPMPITIDGYTFPGTPKGETVISQNTRR